MSSKLVKFAAVVAGVLALGVPSAVFNYRLTETVERQTREELAAEARRTVALAESRIARAVALLDDLARRGVSSCEPADVEALRQATFATTPIKELSIIAPDGSTLCSDLNSSVEHRQVVSSEPIGPDDEVLLEVIRLGGQSAQIIRIRRPAAAGNGIAALMPTELLTPQVPDHSGPSSVNYRITTRKGRVIGEEIAAANAPEDDVLSATTQSERYGIQAMLLLPRSSLAEREGELRAIGAMVTGALALVIFGFVLMLPRQQRENPIAALEEALKAGHIIPYYQPVVDIRTGKLYGAEILARWRKPDGTILLPGSFIPVAESSGIILDLTRALMRQVGKDLGALMATRPHLKMSFNVIAQHFANDEIINDVTEAFRHSSMRLSQVVLEMTERQPVENLTETRRVIASLQSMGVLVAIDDVGTGHSGLSYMLKLGVDIIKIDKMFVDSLGIDANSTAIVQTLIDLAQSLRMEVVAEGVETAEQVIALRNLGIRTAQGYSFAPPLPSSSFVQLLEAMDPLPAGSSQATPTSARPSKLSRAA